ncbi:MAG: hypothetical protein OEM01_02275 [Desulfobulbaceae bacterium]|nr:hypothetical protein [Desulfobulbaceae bacterium]
MNWFLREDRENYTPWLPPPGGIPISEQVHRKLGVAVQARAAGTIRPA